jgi:hypothetical protein
MKHLACKHIFENEWFPTAAVLQNQNVNVVVGCLTYQHVCL